LGSVAAAALPVLLLCYHFDPATGRYTLAILKLLRLAGVTTALTVAGTLFLAFRRDRGRT
jgi:protein SCO1/2